MGFLGIEIVKSLLQDFSSSKIIGLFHGTKDLSLDQKKKDEFTELLSSFGISPIISKERLKLIPFDLESDMLGLDSMAISFIQESCTDIFHVGAKADWVLPYSSLKESNVNGTERAAFLALISGARFHFISSIASIPYEEREHSEKWIDFPLEQIEKKVDMHKAKSFLKRDSKSCSKMDWMLGFLGHLIVKKQHFYYFINQKL